MTQLTLYDGHVPHVAGSETSKAAGASVDRVSLRQKVYALIALRSIYSAGPYARMCESVTPPPGACLGATDDELERVLDMRHQTVSPRRRELVLAGKVVDSGRKRPTRSGRLATVWVTA